MFRNTITFIICDLLCNKKLNTFLKDPVASFKKLFNFFKFTIWWFSRDQR